MKKEFVYRFPYNHYPQSLETTLILVEKLGLFKEHILSSAIRWFLMIEGLYSSIYTENGSLEEMFRADFINEMIAVVDSLETLDRNNDQSYFYDSLPLDTYAIATELFRYIEASFTNVSDLVKSLKTMLMLKGICAENIAAAFVETTIIPAQNAVDVRITIPF